MDAEIHATDKEKRVSGGNKLAVQGAPLELALKRFDGLPYGKHKDQHYVEVQATSWEDETQSTLIAQLNAAELQQLFDFAFAQGMVTPS
jgi:hypothetical protein